jgi:hypothetical protein
VPQTLHLSHPFMSDLEGGLENWVGPPVHCRPMDEKWCDWVSYGSRGRCRALLVPSTTTTLELAWPAAGRKHSDDKEVRQVKLGGSARLVKRRRGELNSIGMWGTFLDWARGIARAFGTIRGSVWRALVTSPSGL